MLKRDYASLVCDPELDGIWENCGLTEATYPEDVRDPSAFFATFETGDNSVVTVETGTVPLDMYYSRAFNFGDDWDEQDICALADTDESWYPNANAACEEGDVELRWDWLENHEEQATEASVFGNPNGDRFYAVWNMELPVGVDDHGEAIYTDMDVEFRRIFYNLLAEAYPAASIAYVSHPAIDYARNPTVILIGTGRDYDRLGEGIVAYRWTSSIDGELGDTARVELPATSFSLGMHDISFSVQDNEGNWSSEASTRLLVAEELVWVYVPSLVH
jgi:hypothetical protein